jgi:hypothetical protein
LIEKSDGHENDAKMTAGTHIVTLMASATILAPSAPSPFDARFRLVIALMSEKYHQQAELEVYADRFA